VDEQQAPEAEPLSQTVVERAFRSRSLESFRESAE
jgi:hypothetical protein